jgi:hypothetical protein
MNKFGPKLAAILGAFAIFLTGVIATYHLYLASRDAEFAVTPTVVGALLGLVVLVVTWWWDENI